MKNIVKNSLYSTLWVALVAQNNLSMAALDFGASKPATIAWATDTADSAVMRLVGNVSVFLSLVAVLYALYGWFKILTAWGHEEWVKAWKTILIQALAWLVVIWLAYSIVTWLVTLILK